MSSRRLLLHASALSDDEYQFYTTSLLSVISVEEDVSQSHEMDDAYYENMNVNVRETRAWLRGRYSHIPSLIIDKILKLFSPNLSVADSLSGGEFFAVLRLVVHVENGKEVDRSLAFVQAKVRQSLNSVPPPTNTSLSTSPSSFSNNPFAHPQPPVHPSQRSESSSTPSTHNPFVHPTLPPRSEDGISKIPPLPPRKPPAQPPSMAVLPPKHILSSHSRLDRSRSPSKLVSTNPLHSSHSLPPTIPPKPIHHVTSTLIKQSLQATKAAQTMKKAEEQLERERVMQVLKSSSTVAGAYSLAGASVTNSSVVVGTNVYNQHQYQQRKKSPSPIMDQGGSGALNMKLGYAASSTSSSSDERAPPLPKRRTHRQQPSPPLSSSSLEQVALATTTHRLPTSAPPSSAASAFSNPEGTSNTHVHAYPHPTSPFGSRSRVHVDSSIAIPYTNSPEHSPRRPSLELPSGGGTNRGRPPPTHPDRKPHHLPYQYHTQPNSHSRSQSYSYSDPFTGSNLDFKNSSEGENIKGVGETFESIYGPSNSSPPTTTIDITPSTPSPNRAFRSKSMHQPVQSVPRSSLVRKRPESVQVFRASGSDIGVEVDMTSPLTSPNRTSNNNNNDISRHTSLMMPTLSANSKNHRRSSLLLSSTASSSPSANNWLPPSPHRQTQFGHSSSSPSLTATPLTGQLPPPPPPHPPSLASSTTATATTKYDHPNSIPIQTPNPLTSLQKTFLQIQPHLDKARYKAEAGLSKRGFVRDGLRTTRGKKSSTGSGAADRDGADSEDLEDGLEGLVLNGGGASGARGKKEVGRRWRDGSGDEDSDWTRSEGMSMGLDRRGRAQRRYSDGDDEEDDGDGVVDGLEKDDLKWPVGEGWKPL